ncbi:MAG TPA: TonB family protein [Bacteroidia bacterium]|nr:TonB family protein [Bacteroidia bacterium]HNT79268.1 TonB family protein [Bacteroidia bacterium]
MSKETKKNEVKGWIGTFAAHGLLILILLWLRFYAPVTPQEDEGIMIDFGNTDTGMGNVESNSSENNNTEGSASELQETSAQNNPSTTEPTLTQNTEEAPKIKENKNNTTPKNNPTPKEQPKEPEKPKVDPKALYPGNNNSGTGSSGSQGNTGGNGNQGNPSGVPNSGGTGLGSSGFSFNLSGRSVKSIPKIEDNSQETGKVVIDIIVDKYGNVTSANGPAKGSTTTSTLLVKKAKEAAMAAKFSPSPDGVEQQKGTITVVFSVQ